VVATPASARSPELKKQILLERKPEVAMAHAQKMLSVFGWNSNQWACLKNLWMKESNWRADARNKQAVKLGGKWVNAGGIPQILGLDPKTPVEDQIKRGMAYIDHRYGSPCQAWKFHQNANWY
jgi:peptidoglycan DL-endopeptidase CwlO